MSVEFHRESPGKFDSRTLSRKTLSRWTGRTIRLLLVMRIITMILMIIIITMIMMIMIVILMLLIMIILIIILILNINIITPYKMITITCYYHYQLLSAIHIN